MYTMSNKQQDYSLFGLFLGDGSYDKAGRMQIVHSNKQRDYISWLSKTAQKWGLKHKVVYDRTYHNRGVSREYSYISLWFNDKNRIEKYQRGFAGTKKIVSKYIADRLTPLGWLWFYLDDANLSVHWDGKNSLTRRVVWHTEGYDLRSQKNLVAALHKRCGAIVKIKPRDSKYYMLSMSAEEIKKFIEFVRPLLRHVPNSLLYKFDMQYVTQPQYNLNWYLQARGSGNHPTG